MNDWTNCVFRDPTVKDEEVWRARFEGKLTSPEFANKGAGKAYLAMLKRGQRKPEYAA